MFLVAFTLSTSTFVEVIADAGTFAFGNIVKKRLGRY